MLIIEKENQKIIDCPLISQIKAIYKHWRLQETLK